MDRQITRPQNSSTEKTDRKGRFVPYLLLLTAALLLTVGVFMWEKQARQESLSQAVASADNVIPEVANAADTFFSESFEKVRTYAKGIMSVKPDKASARPAVRDLAKRTLQENSDLVASWFVFEPNAFDSKDLKYAGKDAFGHQGRMAGSFSRNSGEIKWEPLFSDPEDKDESYEWYRKILKSNDGAISHIYTHVEVDTERMLSHLLPGYGGSTSYFPGTESSYLRNTPCVVLGIPLKRAGKTTGAAGLDISMEPLNAAFDRMDVPFGVKIFLVMNDGKVAAGTDSSSVEKDIDDLYLTGLSDTFRAAQATPSARANRWDFAWDQSGVYCREIKMPWMEENWWLVFYLPSWLTVGDIHATGTTTLVIGYFVLLLAGIVIWAVRYAKIQKRMAEEAAEKLQTDGSTPKINIDPITAERLKSLSRQGTTCRLLAVLFFLPSVFFMTGAEKQFREAEARGDLQTAENAIQKMWTAAIIGLCIGIPLLVLHIATL